MAMTCRLILALSLVSLVTCVRGVKLLVGTAQTECVSETIDVKHFEVLPAEGARIDGRILVSSKSAHYTPFLSVKITAPNGEEIWRRPRVYAEVHFNVAAKGPGTYTVCFSNPWESRSADAMADLVYFQLAHLRRVGGVSIPKGSHGKRSEEVAAKEHMEDVRRSVLSLSEFMQVVKGSLRFLQRKLERHQRTLISNKDRTLTYSGLEVGTLLLVTGIQVYIIQRMLGKGNLRATFV